MNSLALTDGVLFCATLFVALTSKKSPLFRLAAAMFSTAALLGILRFSEALPIDSLHMFVSMITGVSAFPALAIALVFTQWRLVERWQSSLLLVIALGFVGAFIVTMTQSRGYFTACALMAIVGIVYVSARVRCWTGIGSGNVMLLGSLCFALGLSPVAVLQPADVLHLALALGWLGLDKSNLNSEASRRGLPAQSSAVRSDV